MWIFFCLTSGSQLAGDSRSSVSAHWLRIEAASRPLDSTAPVSTFSYHSGLRKTLTNKGFPACLNMFSHSHVLWMQCFLDKNVCGPSAVNNLYMYAFDSWTVQRYSFKFDKMKICLDSAKAKSWREFSNEARLFLSVQERNLPRKVKHRHIFSRHQAKFHIISNSAAKPIRFKTQKFKYNNKNHLKI